LILLGIALHPWQSELVLCPIHDPRLKNDCGILVVSGNNPKEEMSESRHLVSYQIGFISIADFRGCLGITKKEFFITSKTKVFWQFFEID
jgi:hypothetical protein